MVKELGHEHMRALNAIRESALNEAQAKVEAREEGQRVERRLCLEAEAKTNALIEDARYRLGIPISTIARVGLGVSNRNTTYRRLKAATGETVADENGRQVPTHEAPKAYRGKFDLVLNNKGTEYQEYILTLDGFSHNYLEGKIYTGTLTYKEYPEAIASTLVDGDGNEVKFDDTRFTVLVVEIPEIQAAWKALDAE